jgi:hypothetical protein
MKELKERNSLRENGGMECPLERKNGGMEFPRYFT